MKIVTIILILFFGYDQLFSQVADGLYNSKKFELILEYNLIIQKQDSVLTVEYYTYQKGMTYCTKLHNHEWIIPEKEYFHLTDSIKNIYSDHKENKVSFSRKKGKLVFSVLRDNGKTKDFKMIMISEIPNNFREMKNLCLYSFLWENPLYFAKNQSNHSESIIRQMKLEISNSIMLREKAKIMDFDEYYAFIKEQLVKFFEELEKRLSTIEQ